MVRTLALSILLAGCGLLQALHTVHAAQADIDPGVLATYTQMLNDNDADRNRALESLKKQSKILDAVLAAFQDRLEKGLAQYRAGGEAKSKIAGIEQLKTSKAAHAAQKALVGSAFPKPETLGDFRKLVELHETYWQQLMALVQRETPEEKKLRKLEVVVNLLMSAAGKEGTALSVQKVVDEAFTAEQATLLAGERQYLDECRRVYLWNEKNTPFAQPYHRHALKVHNEYRIIHGLLPAELDEKLLEAATQHCEEMAKMNYFAHESPVAEYKTWDMRIRKAGYSGSAGSEGLARAGRGTMGKEWATHSFLMWFWDPHHDPLINPSFRQLAVGFAPGYAGGSYGVPREMHSAKLDPNTFPLAEISLDYALYKKVFTEQTAAKKR